MLDGRAGLMTDDYAIADVLRRAKVPALIVVANKMDDPASAAPPRSSTRSAWASPCSCPPSTASAPATCST